jgi:hypothetical protein
MQQIYLQEKGEEHLRTQNINYLYTLRNDDPKMEHRSPRTRKTRSKTAAGADHPIFELEEVKEEYHADHIHPVAVDAKEKV